MEKNRHLGYMLIRIDQLHIEKEVVSRFDTQGVDRLKTVSKSFRKGYLAREHPRVLTIDQDRLLILREIKSVFGNIACDLGFLRSFLHVDGHILCLVDLGGYFADPQPLEKGSDSEVDLDRCAEYDAFRWSAESVVNLVNPDVFDRLDSISGNRWNVVKGIHTISWDSSKAAVSRVRTTRTCFLASMFCARMPRSMVAFIR